MSGSRVAKIRPPAVAGRFYPGGPERLEREVAALRPGVDGVLFEAGHLRSVFLPQVWEQLPVPREFLGHLKRKAGLAESFWATGVRLSRFTVLKWKEPGA